MKRACPTPSRARCAACGYSLRGLARGGACPECGHSIDDSVTRLPPEPAYRSRFATGFIVIAAGWMAAVALTTLRASGISARLQSMLLLAGAVLGLAGIGVVLSPAGRLPLVWVAWVALLVVLMGGLV